MTRFLFSLLCLVVAGGCPVDPTPVANDPKPVPKVRPAATALERASADAAEASETAETAGATEGTDPSEATRASARPVLPPSMPEIETANPPTGFSIMTWNLEWFYDEQTGDNYGDLPREKSSPSREQWNWRRDAVAASIAAAKPTVVALQEVENQRVLFYLTRAIQRGFRDRYRDVFIQGTDYFTEQDVGFLYREELDLIQMSRYGQTKAMRATKNYYNVSKHVEAVFQVPVGDGYERVTVMNLHLRAKEEVEPIRVRQARLVHLWIADRVAAGENIIVLGDLNTEVRVGEVNLAQRDLGAVMGLQNKNAEDDLVDLNTRLPEDARQTHLLPGREFDRILVSPSLIEDDPDRPDLVFADIKVLRSLAVRGPVDTPEQHWDGYWELPAEERDLSDHWPVMARFEIR